MFIKCRWIFITTLHQCERTNFAFFLTQEDGKAKENMAQKRAALLEKRMRREKESQQKKMQLEAELEQKKEEARYVATSGKEVSISYQRTHSVVCPFYCLARIQ